MEESDSGKVGLDGAGRLAILLHLEDIGGEVPAADVLQLLQMVVDSEVGAEPFDRLIVAVFRTEAALPVVPGQLAQLGNEGVVNAR